MMEKNKGVLIEDDSIILAQPHKVVVKGEILAVPILTGLIATNYYRGSIIPEPKVKFRRASLTPRDYPLEVPWKKKLPSE